MEQQNQQQTVGAQPTVVVQTVGRQARKKDGLKMKDLFRVCLTKWYWFVLSVVLCCGAATLKLLRTPNVYEREASIQIKESGMGSKGSDISALTELGGFETKSTVDNELVAIQTPSIVMEAGKRLHLEYTYMVDGRFHDNVVYGTTLPIQVDIKGLPDNLGASLELTLSPKGDVTMTKFLAPEAEEPNNTVVKGKVGDTLKTPLGDVEVKASAYPNTSNEDVTYKIYRNSMAGMLKGCMASLKAALHDKKASVIDLTYTDVNIQRAEEFLNTLIGVYNERWIQDKNQIAVSTSKFIGERLEVIEQELGSVDDNISSYKSQNMIPDVQAASQMAMQQANVANNKIMDLNTSLYMARQIRLYVNDPARKNELLPANTGINSASVEREIANYNSTMLERNSMIASSSESNPLVQDMEDKLQGMRASIIRSIDNEIANLNAQIQAQQASRSQNNSQLSSNPTQAKHLLSEERQQKVKEALYLFLLQKREENELSQAFTAYNTRLINPPMGSNLPISPNRKKMLMIAFVLGLAIPFVLLYLKEANNTKVRNRKDLEKMKAPFAGEIPQYRSSKQMKVLQKAQRKAGKKVGKDMEVREIVIKAGSRNIINEAFRVVRTNMEFMTEEGETPVIMVLSLLPGSGKTFLSANLSMAYAVNNKKVAVVDLDMRKRSLSNLVENPEMGVANYLAGKVDDWRSLIQPVNAAGEVDLLPVGSIPPNPTELLLSKRLQQLIEEMRKVYDVIIVDCPPAEIVADSNIIARHVTQTMFVVRAGNLERDMLPMIDRYYTENKYPNMSVVLNGTRTGKGSYGYGYGYGYGNYYGSK